MVCFLLFYSYFTLLIFQIAFSLSQGKKRKAAKEEESEEENEDEEEEKEKENEEEEEQEIITEQIIENIKEWREQSEWLFLRWNNTTIIRPGHHWITFFYQSTGKRLTISIWRKIVETHSFKHNSPANRARIAHDLLHSIETAEKFYSSETVEEEAQATMALWNPLPIETQNTTTNTPPPLIQQPQSIHFPITFTSTLTPTQSNYVSRTGD